jgi:hypothetical protein
MKEKNVPCKSMFSNGTEYGLFLDTQCFECTRFRNWHCRILNAIERASFIGESVFPFDDLLEWEHYGGKVCKSFTTIPIARKPRSVKPVEGQIGMEDI